MKKTRSFGTAVERGRNMGCIAVARKRKGITRTVPLKRFTQLNHWTMVEAMDILVGDMARKGMPSPMEREAGLKTGKDEKLWMYPEARKTVKRLSERYLFNGPNEIFFTNFFRRKIKNSKLNSLDLVREYSEAKGISMAEAQKGVIQKLKEARGRLLRLSEQGEKIRQNALKEKNEIRKRIMINAADAFGQVIMPYSMQAELCLLELGAFY